MNTFFLCFCHPLGFSSQSNPHSKDYFLILMSTNFSIYVCILHIYTYIYIYTYTYKHVYIHVRIHVYVRVYIHVYIHLYIYMYIHVYIYIYTNLPGNVIVRQLHPIGASIPRTAKVFRTLC